MRPFVLLFMLNLYYNTQIIFYHTIPRLVSSTAICLVDLLNWMWCGTFFYKKPFIRNYKAFCFIVYVLSLLQYTNHFYNTIPRLVSSTAICLVDLLNLMRCGSIFYKKPFIRNYEAFCFIVYF